MTEKAQLRQQLMAARKALPPEEQKLRDAAIQAQLLDLPEYRNCRTVYIYVSKAQEVATRTIIGDAWYNGKIVAVPRCEADGIMHFYRIDGWNALVPGSFGVKEPAAECLQASDPTPDDLCIVPGLAFDRDGHRLGYGKGYYDRFLTDFPGRIVGLCPAAAMLQVLPREATDRPVEMVITEQYIHRVAR